MLTTKLLADSTGDSSLPAAASPAGAQEARRSHVWGHQTAEVEVPAEQRVRRVDSPKGMDLGDNPEMLGDMSMDGLEVPPEPSAGFEDRYRAANPPVHASPVPSIFPGGCLGSKTLIWYNGAANTDTGAARQFLYFC
jgi:hypothetical protein